MKAILYDSSGKKKSEQSLPEFFSTPVREDLIAKFVESEKAISRQPFSVYKEAGKRHSASGTISHKRHEWKGHYGKGISRAPRKVMWRRGTQFYWVGAETSQSRGGRTAHPSTGLFAFSKINKKERLLAFKIAFAATMNSELLKKRYSSIPSSSKIQGAVIESLPSKTKDLIFALKNIFGDSFNLTLKKKDVRAGKGKRRGRKYKSNAGLLLVIGSSEKNSFKGLEVKTLDEIQITDLYPLGRLTLFTQSALKEMEDLKKHVA